MQEAGGGPPTMRVIRASERFVTRDGGVLSRHSFSFGPHYDPGNVGFGLLVVSNDDVISAGGGYPTHPHRDVEIVTWVLSGALAHRDSAGRGGVVTPGVVQRMSAGRGVLHSELDAGSSPDAPLRFVQMWVPPDVAGADPSYGQADVASDLAGGGPGGGGSGGARLAGGGLVPVVSGMRRHAGAAVGLGQRAAAMHVGRLGTGDEVTLPSAPFVHMYVARGVVDVESVGQPAAVRLAAGRLDEGDAVRLTDEGGRSVRAVTEAELVVWEMHATVGPASRV